MGLNESSREQHLRRDLPEPVDYAAHPEIGRAGRPRRPQARGGQHPEHRLRKIWHKRRDPVARYDTGAPQTIGNPRNRRV
jgi:hypothetical protein